jgi:hypothetical protein
MGVNLCESVLVFTTVNGECTIHELAIPAGTTIWLLQCGVFNTHSK